MISLAKDFFAKRLENSYESQIMFVSFILSQDMEKYITDIIPTLNKVREN